MDWKQLITDLLQNGYTFASLAREMGVTPAAVRAMMRNANQQPRWITGNKLVSIHRSALKKKTRQHKLNPPQLS